MRVRRHWWRKSTLEKKVADAAQAVLDKDQAQQGKGNHSGGSTQWKSGWQGSGQWKSGWQGQGRKGNQGGGQNWNQAKSKDNKGGKREACDT